MASRPSPRNRVGRLLSGLVRQLELPFFGHATAPARPATPDPAGTRRKQIHFGQRSIDYAFRRGRRKTIGFSIDEDGLRIAAPRWVGMRQVEDAIREREDWIFTKLAEMRRHHASIPAVRWEDGGTIPFRGEMLTMRIATPPAEGRITRANAVAFDRKSNTLTIALPPDATPLQWRERVQAWLQDEARAVFRERLALYEPRLGVTHRALRLSSAKTRWGSCTADGRILLNWRLIHFPLSTIDYVVAHELAHLKEMNHGPRFWATVARILPEYEVARSQVKNPPAALLPTL